MRIGSASPSNPRTRSLGRATSPCRADIRSYYWTAVYPYDLAGAYTNFMMGDEGEDRVKVRFGDNYPRLKALKAKYDPTNLFRVNQNIRPAD